MQAAVQREEEVCSVSIDLTPPVRAESIDLRVLIGHRTATPASASVESVADTFKTRTVNFVAVLEGHRLLGMCSRQEIAATWRALGFFAMGAQANPGPSLQTGNAHQGHDANRRCLAHRVCAPRGKFLR